MMVKFAKTVIYHHFYSIHSSREKYFQHHKLDELLINTIKDVQCIQGPETSEGCIPLSFSK